MLANALRLYQQERYDQALPLFENVATAARTTRPRIGRRRSSSSASASSTSSATRTRCARRARRRARARAPLLRADACSGRRALEELPQSAAIITAVGRYPETDVDLFDTPENQVLYHRIQYLMGRARYEQRRFPEAVALLERVPPTAGEHADAQRWLSRARSGQ